MTLRDDIGWVEPPFAGNEPDTLLGGLDRQRATFAWKAGGLDSAALQATVGASTITLGGLFKHLAFTEDYTFGVKFLGRGLPSEWDGVDWERDPDWPWHSAADDTPEQLMTLWQGAVARSRGVVADALAARGLDEPAKMTWSQGTPNLRRLVVDLLEEYARHVGHADLIRESIDGLVGEDPPG